MQKLVLLILGSFLLAGQLAAQTGQDSWDNLKQLRVGEKIEVGDMNLKSLQGKLIEVTGEAISLRTDQGETAIERARVYRVSVPGGKRVASAQQSGSHVYALGGPVVVPRSAFTRWDGTFVHVGGGGEARLADKFGLGGEIGVLKPVTNPEAITAGLASVTPAYHFVPRGSKGKLDPFINGGFSVLFAHGLGAAIHYGGGMNLWLRPRFGLRLEFRHHLGSPEAGEFIHLVAFRLGIVFGTG